MEETQSNPTLLQRHSSKAVSSWKKRVKLELELERAEGDEEAVEDRHPR